MPFLREKNFLLWALEVLFALLFFPHHQLVIHNRGNQKQQLRVQIHLIHNAQTHIYISVIALALPVQIGYGQKVSSQHVMI